MIPIEILFSVGYETVHVYISHLYFGKNTVHIVQNKHNGVLTESCDRLGNNKKKARKCKLRIIHSWFTGKFSNKYEQISPLS